MTSTMRGRPSELLLAAFETIEDEGHIVVIAAGDLCLATVDDLRAALDVVTSAEPIDVVVDLRAVSILSAVAIGVLVHAAAAQRARGKHLTVRNPSLLIRRVLALTETDWLLAP